MPSPHKKDEKGNFAKRKVGAAVFRKAAQNFECPL